ncbi:MAG: DNA polymerase III subunit alpha [Succinivibrionaceae bacterium]|nr:DNA polymerase III subunit alpha [Succinivibrionaceae bacterium]
MSDATENGNAQQIEKKPLKFVHLRIHTDFSLDDGLQHVEEYCKYASKQRWAALAITDRMNVCGLVRLYAQASNGNKDKFPGGVKPIAAVDVNVRDHLAENEADLMTLYAMNENGYHNICEIISRGHRRGKQNYGGREMPTIELEWFAQRNSHDTSYYADDIIVLSGGRMGTLGKYLLKGRQDRVNELLGFYRKWFPDRFYLELTRTDRENEEQYNRLAVALAEREDLPVVATNDVMFMDKEDFFYHEIRVASQMKYTMADPRRPKIYSREQYLKTQEEMCQLFSDIPEALENSVEIAKRCNVYIPLGTPHLPKFPVPENFQPTDEMRERVISVWNDYERKKAVNQAKKNIQYTPVDYTALPREKMDALEEKMRLCCYLIWQSETGLEKRLAVLFPDEDERHRQRPKYYDRLYMELSVIIGMDFPGYFLIVMEFIQWAKDNRIPIGPGRGSGAGSLVAYSIKITDLNPLDFALLFERFLNPERVSMPDFDIDICKDRRGEVIQHVADLYGHDAVSQIITFGSMAAKAAIKDVTRTLNMSYSFGDQLAKLIPGTPGIKIMEAFQPEKNTKHPEDALLLKKRYETEPEVKEVIDISLKLEGVTKSTGKHAGGVVISPSTIVDFSPIALDPDNNPVTQYDKHDIEDAGLIKFDFLGLKTITIIQWALDRINGRMKRLGKKPVDISAIPLDEKECYDVLMSCETTGVFQLESKGMRDLISRLKPNRFDDMIALVALFRPGPLDSGMCDHYIDRKHGREEVSYPMPDYQDECLKPILESTYGVVVYQEQVMQLAQALAGYSLGAADLLRRAMGKKIKEEMVTNRIKFVNGAKELGRNPETAGLIFDIVEKFAEYGFNKSHSAAYALVAYQTLWMKVHYPADYLAALMTGDKDSKEKIVAYVADLRRLGIRISPPDVNTCQYEFIADDSGAVIYGLCGISGIGAGAVEEIVSCRKDGPYLDLFDFCCRVDLKKFSKGMLETLIWVGAFDRIGPHRAAILDALDVAMKYATEKSANAAAGQFDLFSGGEERDPYRPEYRDVPEFPDMTWLTKEKHYLGLYLTGHPINQYRREISYYRNSEIRNLVPVKASEKGDPVTVAGYAQEVRFMTTKKGDRMASLVLDDGTGEVNVLIFPRAFQQYEEYIQSDTVLIVRGMVRVDSRKAQEEESDSGAELPINLIADAVQSVTQARNATAACILVKIRQEQCSQKFVTSLRGVLERYRSDGELPVKFCYVTDKCCAELLPDDGFRVRPSDDLMTDLQTAVGSSQVSVEFAQS